MYQALCLEPIEVSTAISWSKWEDFCKPQANELRATCDHSSHSAKPSHANEMLKTVLKQLVLCICPQETISILSREIFLFCLQD